MYLYTIQTSLISIFNKLNSYEKTKRKYMDEAFSLNMKNKFMPGKWDFKDNLADKPWHPP